MLLKSVSAIAIATFAATVALAATPTTKVEEDISEKNSTQKITWDKLADDAAPAAAAINAKLRAELVEQACGASDEPDRSYDYEATATTTDVNANYVAYSISVSSYCGGAHPNYGTYHQTYDAKTGEALDLDKEVPRQSTDGDNVDWDAHDKYQQELAEVMLAEAKASNSTALKDTQCFEDMSDADVVQQIKDFWPSISGVSNGKVITSISPPHVATPCQFDLPVSVQAVDKFLAPDGKIKQWLK